MKKIILTVAVINVVVMISCNPKNSDTKGWTGDPKDSIPYAIAKVNIDRYQKAVKTNPDLSVLYINLSSRILRRVTSSNVDYDAIRLLPAACNKTTGKDSAYLIIEIYDRDEGCTFYDMSHFYTPKDLTSEQMRKSPVLCPEPPLCPVDIE